MLEALQNKFDMTEKRDQSAMDIYMCSAGDNQECRKLLQFLLELQYIKKKFKFLVEKWTIVSFIKTESQCSQWWGRIRSLQPNDYLLCGTPKCRE